MKTEIKIYIGITLLMLVDLVLYLTLSISLVGNLLDRILFWIWFIGTFIIVIKEIRQKWAQIYGFVLIGLTLLSFMPMAIPIFTIAVFAIDEEESIRIDNEIRMAETSKSVIGMPYIAVTKNYWLIEKEIGEIEFYFQLGKKIYRIKDAESIMRLPETLNKKIRLEFKFENGKVIREI